MPRKPPPPPPAPLFTADTPSPCIFLVASPGSGSTTLTELLRKHTGCDISGEKRGALSHLAAFHDATELTEAQWRGNPHVAAAWRRPEAGAWHGGVHAAEVALARALLYPDGRRCWGFKEVRFGRGRERLQTFSRDVAFLSKLCARPRIVLHTRRDLAAELLSLRKIVGRADFVRFEQEDTRQQWACFDAYAGLPANGSTAMDRRAAQACAPPADGPAVFRHTLEDYLEQNANHAALWRYLGFEPPPPRDGAPLWLTGNPRRLQASANRSR